MKILVVGGGGREHAIGWAVSKDERHTQLYFAPGNGGTAAIGRNVAIQVTQIEELLAFAQEEQIDLTVVGPELPLTLGIVDRFREKGLKVFGPTQAAARLEGSKAYAKEFMQKYAIPTAGYRVFDEITAALEAVEHADYPLVVKADGIAAGKGVLICQDKEEAKQALEDILQHGQFGEAGEKVVVEEFLRGTEASVLCFTDGKTIKPMVSAQDYKRAFDGDEGLNTGGMGCISPAPAYTDEIAACFETDIMQKALKGIQGEGLDYRGVLYFGLMIGDKGIRILEFNARFGDPETEAVLMRLKTPLVDVLSAVCDGRLDEIELEWKDDPAVCVVIASQGYPGSYPAGIPITIEQVATAGHGELPDQETTAGNEEPLRHETAVFHAGTAREDGLLVTAGGRVLVVSGCGSTSEAARDHVYKACKTIYFDGMHYRKDIGAHMAGTTTKDKTERI